MSPLNAYAKVNVQTASSQQIMITLFQTALGHMRASIGAFENGDTIRGSKLAEKAATIVLGLQGTLKTEVAPELCERLSELYSFIACRLAIAGSQFSATPVAEAERVFSPLVDAFSQAVTQTTDPSKAK
jgi:flagellar biosynthetic protein FliS